MVEAFPLINCRTQEIFPPSSPEVGTSAEADN